MPVYADVISLRNPIAGFVHEYAPRLQAYEFKSNNNKPQSDKAVIFIQGLNDGLINVPYLQDLAIGLDKIGWTLFQIINSSSFMGWGTGSLQRDVEEIAKLVEYLRSSKGGSRRKVVLMGYSTGSQDVIQYFYKFKPSDCQQIDGAIMHSPVSDRETIRFNNLTEEQYNEFNAEAESFVASGRADHVLPKKFSDAFLGAPISAYRWLSLSKYGGDDDFFSSDLPKDFILPIFSTIDKPFLTLISEKDECLPDFVNVDELLNKWKGCADAKFWSKHSKVIEGATHIIGPGSLDSAVGDLVKTVCDFIEEV